jgi:hypothetical protein
MAQQEDLLAPPPILTPEEEKKTTPKKNKGGRPKRNLASKVAMTADDGAPVGAESDDVPTYITLDYAAAHYTNEETGMIEMPNVPYEIVRLSTEHNWEVQTGRGSVVKLREERYRGASRLALEFKKITQEKRTGITREKTELVSIVPYCRTDRLPQVVMKKYTNAEIAERLLESPALGLTFAMSMVPQAILDQEKKLRVRIASGMTVRPNEMPPTQISYDPGQQPVPTYPRTAGLMSVPMTSIRLAGIGAGSIPSDVAASLASSR